jgi:hypothetical protein
VYDIAREALLTGGVPVIDERVPFPLAYRGRQAEIRRCVQNELLRAGMKSRATREQRAM